jgi:hypothetical protein
MLGSGQYQHAADTRGGVMKFIPDVGFPLKPLNTPVCQATAGRKSARRSALSRPRVYSIHGNIRRSAVVVVDPDSAAQASHVTEPLHAQPGPQSVSATCIPPREHRSER